MGLGSANIGGWTAPSGDATARDPQWKIWGRRIGWTCLVFVAVAPWPLISWGRAQRSAPAPAVLEEVWEHPKGRFTVGAYSFMVDGQVYSGVDQLSSRVRKGSRTWSADELEGMHVCYHPEHPGEDSALAPARYGCGDPDILATDGGW